MTYSFRSLKKDELDSVYDLFLECFKDNEYYRKYNVLGEPTKIKDIISHCIERNWAKCVFDEENLIAFIIWFNYQEVKKNKVLFDKIFKVDLNGKKFIPYEELLHRKIQHFGNKTFFLLALGVNEKYRSRKIATALFRYLINKYRYNVIVTDITSEVILNLCNNMGGAIDEIDDGYYCAFFDYRHVDSMLEMNTDVHIIMADKGIINKIPLDSKLDFCEIQLQGYTKKKFYGLDYFYEDIFSDTIGYVCSLTYTDLLKYQRFVNLSNCAEHYLLRNGEYYIYYSLDVPYITEPLYNDNLRRMIRDRAEEFDIIADCIVQIPFIRKSSRIETEENNAMSGCLLDCLDYQTHLEAGIHADTSFADLTVSFHERIERVYLGKFYICIYEEIVYGRNFEKESIGSPGSFDLFISEDTKSNRCVLTIVSLSMPLLISHFFDCCIRGQLYISEIAQNGNKYENLYLFLEEKYFLEKCGNPKVFAIIPKEKKEIRQQHLGSLLMGETIYPNGEDFGEIIDKQIMDKIKDDNGMGQYDRAFVCASTSVVLQLQAQKDSIMSIGARIKELAITAFYIELILFEEATINLVKNSITSFFDKQHEDDIDSFLGQIDRIYDEYSKAIYYVDLNLNYPSSQSSISMLRTAFNIEALVQTMEKSKDHLQNSFEVKSSIKDRFESRVLNLILLFLTVLQGVYIVFPMLFESNKAIDRKKVIGIGLVTLIVLIFVMIGKLNRKRKKRRA